MYLYFSTEFACRYLYAPNANAPPSKISAYRPMPRPAALPWALVEALLPAPLVEILGAGSFSCFSVF